MFFINVTGHLYNCEEIVTLVHSDVLHGLKHQGPHIKLLYAVKLLQAKMDNSLQLLDGLLTSTLSRGSISHIAPYSGQSKHPLHT